MCGYDRGMSVKYGQLLCPRGIRPVVRMAFMGGMLVGESKAPLSLRSDSARKDQLAVPPESGGICALGIDVSLACPLPAQTGHSFRHAVQAHALAFRVE